MNSHSLQNMAELQAGLQIDSREVLIAIMGIAGASKSSFVSHFTDENVPIGKSLHSRTLLSKCRPKSSCILN